MKEVEKNKKEIEKEEKIKIEEGIEDQREDMMMKMTE